MISNNILCNGSKLVQILSRLLRWDYNTCQQVHTSKTLLFVTLERYVKTIYHITTYLDWQRHIRCLCPLDIVATVRNIQVEANTQRDDPNSPKLSIKIVCHRRPCPKLLWIGLSCTTSVTLITIARRNSLNSSKHLNVCNPLLMWIHWLNSCKQDKTLFFQIRRYQLPSMWIESISLFCELQPFRNVRISEAVRKV